MKILMLSIDEAILRPGSDVALRMARYGPGVDELHIVVFSKGGGGPVQLARNVWAYSTNTRHSLFFISDFYRLAKDIFSKSSKLKAPSWIITSQDAFLHLVALFIRRKLGIPIEIQIHTDFLSLYFRRESFKNYIRYVLYSYAVQRADTIRVVSPRLAEGLKKESGISEERIITLPIFIDEAAIARAPVEINVRKKYPQFDFIVLMAGRLTKEKNIRLALDGFYGAVRRYSRAGLLIVGDGPEKQSLQERAKSLELSSNVVFEPALSFEKLISYYKTADLFMLTSNYEGYGRTLVEATAAKLPVITTDVGIARELFVNGMTGTIIPVGNRGVLTDALCDAIGNYQKYKTFGEKAGEMLLDKPQSYEKYLQAMKVAWEKCRDMQKEV